MTSSIAWAGCTSGRKGEVSIPSRMRAQPCIVPSVEYCRSSSYTGAGRVGKRRKHESIEGGLGLKDQQLAPSPAQEPLKEWTRAVRRLQKTLLTHESQHRLPPPDTPPPLSRNDEDESLSDPGLFSDRLGGCSIITAIRKKLLGCYGGSRSRLWSPISAEGARSDDVARKALGSNMTDCPRA